MKLVRFGALDAEVADHLKALGDFDANLPDVSGKFQLAAVNIRDPRSDRKDVQHGLPDHPCEVLGELFKAPVRVFDFLEFGMHHVLLAAPLGTPRWAFEYFLVYFCADLDSFVHFGGFRA